MALRAVRVCARTWLPRKASGKANRWNAADQFVVYLSEHFGTAMLESVVHAASAPPPPAHAVWALIPDGVAVEELEAAALPTGWDDPHDLTIARTIGAAWYESGRSVALLVPSVPGRPFERNVVINTTHAKWPEVAWGAVEDIPWDPRLFG